MRPLTKTVNLRGRALPRPLPLALPSVRRQQPDAAPVEARAPAREPLDQVARARRGGSPQDMALYRCQCGFSFDAPVTASVSCPRCGGPQAW